MPPKKKSDAEEDEFFSARDTTPRRSTVAKKPAPLAPALVVQRTAALPPASKTRVKQTELSEEDSVETDSEETEPDEEEAATPRCVSRPLFDSNSGVIRQRKERARLAGSIVGYKTIKFDAVQDVVEIVGGRARAHDKETERLVKNHYRRWGAHRALTQYKDGGYCPAPRDKPKAGFTRIEFGSAPPAVPSSHPFEVHLNIDNVKPDSQTLNGSLKPEKGPAKEECHRLAKQIDALSWAGGFKEPALPSHMASVEYQTEEEKKLAKKKVKPRKKKATRRSKRSGRGCDTESSGSRSTSEDEDDDKAFTRTTVFVVVPGSRTGASKKKQAAKLAK